MAPSGSSLSFPRQLTHPECPSSLPLSYSFFLCMWQIETSPLLADRSRGGAKCNTWVSFNKLSIIKDQLHCIKSEMYLAKWKWILRSGPKLKMLVKFHCSNGSFPNPLNWWWIRFGCTALDQCYWNKENWFANWKSTMHFSDLHI
jgi:hypothetical protein